MTTWSAVELEHRRRDVHQLGDEVVGKARARERDVGVLEDVGHPPDAVVVLDQRVLLLDALRGRCPWTTAILSRITLNTYG